MITVPNVLISVCILPSFSKVARIGIFDYSLLQVGAKKERVITAGSNFDTIWKYESSWAVPGNFRTRTRTWVWENWMDLE